MTEDNRTRDDLLEEITDLERERDRLIEAKDGAEDHAQKLEDELADRDSPTEAAHRLLDECVRPCGSNKFTIPDNPRVHDAIRAMADAIGRNV